MSVATARRHLMNTVVSSSSSFVPTAFYNSVKEKTPPPTTFIRRGSQLVIRSRTAPSHSLLHSTVSSHSLHILLLYIE